MGKEELPCLSELESLAFSGLLGSRLCGSNPKPLRLLFSSLHCHLHLRKGFLFHLQCGPDKRARLDNICTEGYYYDLRLLIRDMYA